MHHMTRSKFVATDLDVIRNKHERVSGDVFMMLELMCHHNKSTYPKRLPRNPPVDLAFFSA